MDVYCHPFTSGGQEIPIQEAKLVELITLVTNYSCGEDMCVPEAESLPLDWAEYREPGTQFIKASTYPESIAKQLSRVLKTKPEDRKRSGEKARSWVIENYSVNKVGPRMEKFFDDAPFTEYDFLAKEEQKDPFCQIEEIQDNEKWILELYKRILKYKNIDENDEGCKYWIKELNKGVSRGAVEDYFRQIAQKENQKNEKVEFEETLGDDKGKRILYVMPQSIGDVILSTSLFRSIKEQYPNYNLYVATLPQFHEVLYGNPHVYKVINYIPQMDNLMWLEGAGSHNGYFEIAFLPHLGTQRVISYLHNGKDKIAYKDLSYENV